MKTCIPLWAFEKLLRLGTQAAGAHPLPNDNEGDGNSEDQSGDGVDFRSDAAAEAAPDFEREGIVAADQEKGDGDFVHGESEDEKAGGDQREFEIGQRDAPKRLPRSCAEVERGFFLSAVHFLQAGKELGGGHGDERGAVPEKNREQAELYAGKNGKHQERKAGDDAWKNQWEENKAAEKRFAGKGGAVQREGRKQT